MLALERRLKLDRRRITTARLRGQHARYEEYVKPNSRNPSVILTNKTVSISSSSIWHQMSCKTKKDTLKYAN